MRGRDYLVSLAVFASSVYFILAVFTGQYLVVPSSSLVWGDHGMILREVDTFYYLDPSKEQWREELTNLTQQSGKVQFLQPGARQATTFSVVFFEPNERAVSINLNRGGSSYDHAVLLTSSAVMCLVGSLLEWYAAKTSLFAIGSGLRKLLPSLPLSLLVLSLLGVQNENSRALLSLWAFGSHLLSLLAGVVLDELLKSSGKMWRCIYRVSVGWLTGLTLASELVRQAYVVGMALAPPPVVVPNPALMGRDDLEPGIPSGRVVFLVPFAVVSFVVTATGVVWRSPAASLAGDVTLVTALLLYYFAQLPV